jgi:serine protease Do
MPVLLSTALLCAWVLSAGNSTVAEGLPALPAFADLAESVKPAVVNISTLSSVRIPGNPFQFFFGEGPRDGSRASEQFDAYIRRFFGDIPDRELKQKSLGSGVIIDRSGYILTNNHVVQRADEITVRMTDGREFRARVMGRDAKTDLSLIKIPSEGHNLPFLPLGDSDKMRVGDWVLAIGNPFGLAHTVTKGIISATGRVIGTGPYDNFLQTDAPVNPGNSGGPIVSLKGEVVGIATAIIATGQGIGFAVPSNMARDIAAQLREKGRVVRGWMGVVVQEMTPEIARSFGMKEASGALIGDVVAGGPAEVAGMKRGDIIVGYNDKPVKSVSDLPMMVARTPIGSTARVKVMREGKEKTLKLKVGEMPEEIG